MIGCIGESESESESESVSVRRERSNTTNQRLKFPSKFQRIRTAFKMNSNNL